MRSRPFTSTPRVSRPSTRISHHNRSKTNMSNNGAVPLADLDLDTAQLLPCWQRRRRVRIQGRLAIVRTVSVANLQQAKNGNPIAHINTNHKDMRGSPLWRQDSCDDSEVEDGDDEDDVARCDAQFRGYGIGGAGNIRRPTDIMGAPTSASPSLLSLIHTSHPSPTIHLNATKPSKLRSRMAGFLRNLGSYKRSKDLAGGSLNGIQ
ncbi:hypothetical protein GGR58DRAFT_27073 [Xylaria digitata]|nr:hypothetical protein GGR58DRAFT_27073 [Xylaria digitata]